MNKVIAHIDMDAFFAAIEERDNERLRGLPVVVGADPLDGKGRGVVSTANYKAREYGIHSAMPISQAWRNSEKAKMAGKPAAVFVFPNFRRYVKVSESVVEIVRRHSKIVEQASIDEAYFDLSYAKYFIQAQKICQNIKDEIKAKEKLTASIGLGPNKLIAKLTSDFKKPDGLTVITEDKIDNFIKPMPIRKLPGIGPKTEMLFLKMGVKTVGDLQKIPEEKLVEILGKWGIDLYEKARGRDDSELTEEWIAKSVGEQETFQKDTSDSNFIFERLFALSENVFSRFKKEGFKSFKTVTITVRFYDFETKSRSHTLTSDQNSLKTIKLEAIKLITPFLDSRENTKRKPIRLVGVRVEKLN